MEVFIVIKYHKDDYCHQYNEGVFTSEDIAKDYIKLRKAAKDRDDRGCNFRIEPWTLQNGVNPFNIT